MTEQELLKRIEESAARVEVPKSISPRAVKGRIEAIQRFKEEPKQKSGKGETHVKKWGRKPAGLVAAVAAAALAIGAYAAMQKDDSGNLQQTAQTEQAAEEAIQNTETKQNAGDLYVIAGDYKVVYDAVEKPNQSSELKYSASWQDVIMAEAEATTGSIETAPVGGLSEAVNAAEDMADASNSKESYSKTNLQTEGVDESDIVKTDGEYIYTVDDSRVVITDVQNREMRQIGEITLSMEDASDSIVEMYVDGNMLNLIVQRENSNLEKSAAADEEALADVYYMNTETVTEVKTYDIRDRQAPKENGSVVQDGYYKTSRKIGDILYLFTQEEIELSSVERAKAEAAAEEGGWIPTVNGKAVMADCIYVPEKGKQGLVISSINVKSPKDVVDCVMILNNYVEIYVSTEAFYLYGQEGSFLGGTTQIAKFSMKNGVINAAGATSVKGMVTDSFAIHEKEGNLRLLTTDRSGSEAENRLYLFDEKLKLEGKLEGIAKGEEIYAARYLGNIVYFVTYRNTDPLFAVDLTDTKNPKILSELKITGFSEYLHFWGEDKLLGIGYETDPDNGERKGIKLAMFDISNPAELHTLGSLVIENIDYCPALYQYKYVLAEPRENLIGFAGETYRGRTNKNYFLFAWEDGAFQERMTANMNEDGAIEQCRGLYIGRRFYLVNPNSGITSFDREDGYKRIQKLVFD
ncbi:MAG: beta-propeller domain-containing protein [Roseburia sp.]